MSSRKLLKSTVIVGLVLGLLVALAGLIQAAPAASVIKMEAAGFAPGLENMSPAQGDLSTRPGLALPSDLPPKMPQLQPGTPILTVTKSADPDPVNAGEVLTYTIVVTNGGTDDATGAIISDALDSNVSFAAVSDSGTYSAGVTTWEVGVIPMDQTISRNLWVTVNNVPSGTILSNTASVTSTEGVNDSDTISTTVNTEANLVLEKTDWPDPVEIVFDPLTYTLSVTNTGPSDATGVVLTDILPASVNFISASPGCTEAGGTVTCNLGTIVQGDNRSVKINVRPQAKGTITNQAEVEANEPDPDTTDNTDVEDTLIQPADVSIIKTDSPDPVLAGSPLTYILTAINAGPNPATGVMLIDTLPTSVDFVSASLGCTESGGTVICNHGTLFQNNSAIYTIVVTPMTDGVITNTAEVTANEPDPEPTDNTNTAVTTVDPVTDLEISKGDAPDPVIAGENLTYTLTITNNGPSEANGIVVTDTLPAGVTFVSAPDCSEASGTVTCELGSLASGANTQVTILVEVDSSMTGTLSNSANVSGNEFDPDVENNSVTENTTVDTETDLRVSKSDDPDPVIAGEDLTYVLTIIDRGPSDATGVTLTDDLPSGVTFQSSTPGSPTCSHAGGTVTCNLGSLASGANTQVTILVKVDSSTTGTLSNSASVTGNETDPRAFNNTSIEETTVNTEADLSVTKNSSPNSVFAGDILTYSISVTNNGPSDANGVTLSDNLPADVTFQSSTPGAPTCTHSGGTVTCNLGTLASGDTAMVDIVVSVGSSAEGNLANTATVSSNTFDPNGGNDSDTENTPVGAFYMTYLPIVLKPSPTELSVFNDNTGDNVKFTVVGTGVSCTVPDNATQFCGSFLPGTYTVEVVSACGSGTFLKTYSSGPQTTRVFCN